MEDSLKLFRGTKLYGLPIVTKNYFEHQEDAVFHEQLNSYKHLTNVECSSQPNVSNKRKLNIQSPNNKNKIPESFAEHSIHGTKTNKNNLKRKSTTITKLNYKKKSTEYRGGNSYSTNYNSEYINEHISLDISRHNRIRNKKSKHNHTSGLIVNYNNDRDTHHSQTYDHKQQNNNIQTSSNWNKSTYQDHECFLLGKNNVTNEVLPVRDLRDTLLRKRSVIHSDYLSNTNANSACTSLLDLRDIMYHSKIGKNKYLGHYHEPNSYNWWLEKNCESSSFSEKEFHTNKIILECRNESNTKHDYHFTGKKYKDWNFNKNKLHYDCIQDNEYPINYNNNGNYTKKHNWTNNIKYIHTHSQNMESSGRQYNSYCPYVQKGESRERKEFNNRNNNRSGFSRNNKRNHDRSRQNYNL